MISLLALFACAPAETASGVTVEEAPLAAGLDCSGAAGAFDALAPELDAAIEFVEITRLIEQNYNEVFGLAIRSASSVTSAADRSGNALEAAARMEEAARLTADFPELAPAAFGFEAIDIRTARAATAAVPALLDTTAAAAAAVATAERAFFVAELQFPAEYADTFEACGFEAPGLPEPAFDTDPVGDALFANVEEAQALIAAIEMADGVVEGQLEEIRGYAVRSSSETVDDTQRAKLQRRFERATLRIDRVTGMAVFNDYFIADGSQTVLRALTDPGDAAEGMITIHLPDLGAARLGVDVGALDLSTATGASAAIDNVDIALQWVHNNQAHLAAVGAVLELEAERLTVGE